MWVCKGKGWINYLLQARRGGGLFVCRCVVCVGVCVGVCRCVCERIRVSFRQINVILSYPNG